MNTERPFLTAEWVNLAVLSWPVERELLEPHLPAGVELDEYAGTCYASLVAFEFNRTRLAGWPAPGHQRFGEINLRFYVRRETQGAVHKGVVFIKEMVCKRLVALLANRLYYERYAVVPLRYACTPATHASGPRLEYSFRLGRRWHRLAAQGDDAPSRAIAPGTQEEFLLENYWGYSHGGPRGTCEYRVAHRPWRYWPARELVLDCDLAAVYGRRLGAALAGPPESALLVDGSAIEVYPGQKIPATRPEEAVPSLQ